MPTTKDRLNITLTPYLEEAIGAYAKQDRIPRATMASKLILEAIELREDMALGIIVHERMKKGAKMIPHEEFWRKVQNRIRP
ncbi:MAG TPA: DUF6290 family protein [Candidatus Paceibacterota bacterium]